MVCFSSNIFALSLDVTTLHGSQIWSRRGLAILVTLSETQMVIAPLARGTLVQCSTTGPSSPTCAGIT